MYLYTSYRPAAPGRRRDRCGRQEPARGSNPRPSALTAAGARREREAAAPGPGRPRPSAPPRRPRPRRLAGGVCTHTGPGQWRGEGAWRHAARRPMGAPGRQTPPSLCGGAGTGQRSARGGRGGAAGPGRGRCGRCCRQHRGPPGGPGSGASSPAASARRRPGREASSARLDRSLPRRLPRDRRRLVASAPLSGPCPRRLPPYLSSLAGPAGERGAGGGCGGPWGGKGSAFLQRSAAADPPVPRAARPRRPRPGAAGQGALAPPPPPGASGRAGAPGGREPVPDTCGRARAAVTAGAPPPLWGALARRGRAGAVRVRVRVRSEPRPRPRPRSENARAELPALLGAAWTSCRGRSHPRLLPGEGQSGTTTTKLPRLPLPGSYRPARASSCKGLRGRGEPRVNTVCWSWGYKQWEENTE